MPGDLHTHTTFSDGSCQAELLPRLAAAAGLNALAITDHDSMAGLRFGYAHPQLEGVQLIPGMELSGYDPVRAQSAYFVLLAARLQRTAGTL